MNSYAYPPDLLVEINKVCKEPAVIIFNDFSERQYLIQEIETFLVNIYAFIASNVKDLGAIDYMLKLNIADKSNTGTLLTPEYILKEKASYRQLYEVNQAFRVIQATCFDNPSDSGLSKFTREDESIIIYVWNGLDTKLYSKGFTISEVNAANPSAKPLFPKPTARFAREYKQSLKDFYNARIKNNTFTHWHDKPKRILIAGRMTEEIFQVNLTNWLRENINAAKVTPKVKKISQDETDIEITEIGGNSYLIEIKWLGINAASTKCDESKIEEAINQVKNYLAIDQDILEATLVVYDGRPLSEFEKLASIDEVKQSWKELDGCRAQTLPLKAKGFVFFLVSEPASSRGAI